MTPAGTRRSSSFDSSHLNAQRFRKKQVAPSFRGHQPQATDSCSSDAEAVHSLHTVFVVVYLQETAWIVTPLLVCANVLLHAVAQGDKNQFLHLAAFVFFLLSAVALAAGLWLIQYRALPLLQPFYLLPYFVAKLLRMCTLSAVAIYIVVDANRRHSSFYITVYGSFEVLAGLIVLEILWRSWRFLRKPPPARAKVGFRLSLSPKKESEVLWREPKTSIRNSQSIP